MTNFILPSAVMPALLGFWLTKFPTHTRGFQTFFMLGGIINQSQTLMFWLCVHPLDEPLDLACQCTRHRFAGRQEYDLVRRKQMEEKTVAAYSTLAQQKAAPGAVDAQPVRRLQAGAAYMADYRRNNPGQEKSDLRTKLV